MKDIREVYPDAVRDGIWIGAYDYRPLLESFGYEILLQVDDQDYSGDSRVLFRDGDRYGVLVFGWGSCSVCDALQACSSYEEIDELRQELHRRIRWGSREEILHYLETHDWEGDWCWHAPETRQFLEQAKELLRGDS